MQYHADRTTMHFRVLLPYNSYNAACIDVRDRCAKRDGKSQLHRYKTFRARILIMKSNAAVTLLKKVTEQQ